MNTKKSVYNRLFAEDKVELASERVELGLVEDVQKDYAKYAKSQINGNNKTNAVVESAKQAIALYQQAIKDYALVTQQINYIKKQATDLGVPLPATINALDKEVASGISFMNNRIKNLTTAAQAANK